MVKIMSNSKRIKEKVHFHVSGLAGAVHRNNIINTFLNITHTSCRIFYTQKTKYHYIKIFLKHLTTFFYESQMQVLFSIGVALTFCYYSLYLLDL